MSPFQTPVHHSNQYEKFAEKLMGDPSFTNIYFYKKAKYHIVWVINWIVACYGFVKNPSVPISIAYVWMSYIFHELLIKMENFVLLEPLKCKLHSYFLTDTIACAMRDFNFLLECKHIFKYFHFNIDIVS